MSVEEQPHKTGVIVLRKQTIIPLRNMPKSQSFWVDAFYRLIRNRAAVMGGAVILLIMIMALFAPLLAPASYDEAVLSDNNAAPEWITQVFPTMVSKSNGGYVTI